MQQPEIARSQRQRGRGLSNGDNLTARVANVDVGQIDGRLHREFANRCTLALGVFRDLLLLRPMLR